VDERNLARNTQRSYRDVLVLLLPFIADFVHKSVDQLQIDDLTAEHVRRFLHDVEQRRHCSVTTRNQRLAAIHALARFIGQRSPEHIAWCGQLRTIPFKKTAQTPITYLEKAEMDALLGAPDRRTAQGRRDYGLLLFLYNTGARADEAAQLRIRDLTACLKSGWRGNMSALSEPEVEGTGCHNATPRISPTQNGPSCGRSSPPPNPVGARAPPTCARWSMQSSTACGAGANGGCSPPT